MFSLKKVNDNQNNSQFFKFNKIINTQTEIYTYSSYGPTFGSGHNIYVSDNANTNNNCFDKSYNNSYEMGNYSHDTWGWLSGEKCDYNRYTLQNYEVFKVNE